jgi:hypothetical protein
MAAERLKSMPGIDDPIDAVKKQYPEESSSPLGLILDVASNFDIFVGVVNTIRNQFSKDTAIERVKALLTVFESTIRRLERDVQRISLRLESPEFVETLVVAVNESIRTSDVRKIARFGSILGYSVAEQGNPRSSEDASAYIRDLAQLGEGDIEAMRILHSIQAPLFVGKVVSTDPNPYTALITQVLTAVDQAGISRDDFYSRCSRLNGFGLAIEVMRNDRRMALGDHCFRLTKRGARLVEMISLTGDPVDSE